MANRSLWPEGCEVQQKHLEYDTTERISSIVSRASHMAKYGVVSGLTVTPNSATPTLIDIAGGNGYVPIGEYVEVSTAQTSQQLASYISGDKNYVLVMYSETQTDYAPHETSGLTKPTRAEILATIRIVTEAQYNALPATSSTMSVDAKDRALVVAVVTAKGNGIALTQSNIESPSSFGEAKYVSVLGANGTVHAQPVNITGVTIIRVSGDTEPGDNGELSYVVSPKSLSWKAPGESALGSAVLVTNSDAITLVSSGGKELTLDMAFTRLPITNASDTLKVSNLYSQSIPRFSSVDVHHRSLIGGGQPTYNNPHGMTMDDLAPGVAGSLEQHQDVMHSNGIAPGSTPGLLECTLNSSNAGYDSVTVNVDFQSGDAVYVNGRRIEYVSTNISNTIDFSDETDVNPSVYGFYLSQDKYVHKSKRLQHKDQNFNDKLYVINLSQNVASGTYSILWTTGNVLSFDGGIGVDVAAPTMNDQPRYTRLVSQDCISYIDVYIKVGTPSGSDISGNVEIYDELDLSLDLPIAYINYSGKAVLGSTSSDMVGYRFGANAPMYFDRRTYGTLMPENINTLAGYESARALAVDTFAVDSFLALPSSYDYAEYVSNGSANSSNYDDYWFNLKSVSGLSVVLNGGVAYLGGKRHLIKNSQAQSSPAFPSLQANSWNYVYINSDGKYALLSGVSSVLFDIELNKLAYSGKPEVGVALFITAASTVFAAVDLRPYSYKRIRNDTRFGQVGLDGYKRAVITSTGTTGSSLTVNGSGADAALRVNGAGTATSAAEVIAVSANQNGLYAKGKGTSSAVKAETYDSGPAISSSNIGSSAPTITSVGAYGVGAGIYGSGTGFGVVGVGGGGSFKGTVGANTVDPSSSGVVGIGGLSGSGVFGLASASNSSSGVLGYGGATTATGVKGVAGVGSLTAATPAYGVHGTGLDGYATWGVYGEGGSGLTGLGGVKGVGQGISGNGSDGVHGIGGGTLGSGGYFKAAGIHTNGSYAVVAESSSGMPIKLSDGGYSLCEMSNSLNRTSVNSVSSANLINNWVTFRLVWVNDPNNPVNNIIYDEFEVKSHRNFSSIQVYNDGDVNANLRIVWTNRLSSLWLPVLCSAWIEAEKGESNEWLAGDGNKPWPVWQYRYKAGGTGADDPQPNFTRIQLGDGPASFTANKNYNTSSALKYMITVSVVVVGPVVS